MEALTIGGETIEPGTLHQVDIPIGQLPTHTPVHLPVTVIHGVEEGPRLWLSAALHGDEINGVEIVRSALRMINPQTLKGSVVAVPVVNVFGFLNESRYLPDRRDLNRCFPGSANGSLASRLAHLMMTEVIAHCTHGIDLHTGSDHRVNYPQIRGNMKDAETLRLARAFGAPIIMHSAPREGTIRTAATREGIPVLLYEGGEPLRFDEDVIEVGRRGILRVMDALEMRPYEGEPPAAEPRESNKSRWVRTGQAGLLRLKRKMGDYVEEDELLGVIEDILGSESYPIRASCEGMIIGLAINPIVYPGDAVVHIARF